MFEAAETGRTMAKVDYTTEVAGLRWQLLDAQRRLQRAPFPLVILFGGVDAAGKSETAQLLNAWMDPRWIVTRAFGTPSDEERERPPHWRFWRELPPRGRIGMFLSAWYSVPLLERVHRRRSRQSFESALRQIAEFERMLAEDGTIVLKFWMHLSKSAQRKRLRALEKDPLTRWRVTRTQWKNWKRYGDFVKAAEQMILQTNVAEAPWIIIEGLDERYRNVAVGRAIRDALSAALQRSEAALRRRATATRRTSRKTAMARRSRHSTEDRSVLDTLDMRRAVSKQAFPRQLEKWQGRLALLARRADRRKVSTILVFEGWDAAGKGGAIRRLTGALDPRMYRVIPIAAPSDEERAHHYLWRFWRHLDRAGRVTIFDRSWYGRVLVERIEGLAAEGEWKRAYAEINQFEDQLLDHGIVLLKFWLHVTKDEQLRRFEERSKSPYKSWKLGPEDWRNREKWEEYELAVNDMVAGTSTHRAPWTLVEANDKYYARIKVLETTHNALKAALQG